MTNFKIDFNKSFLKVLIVYATVFIAGVIVAVIFGINLDINFKGGARISYSHTGELADSEIDSALSGAIEGSYTVSQSSSLAGETKTFVVNLVGKKTFSTETQTKMLSALQSAFPDNAIDVYDSNSVSPTVAGDFFLKSMVAVLITAVLVVIYVGIRFRKIGGISAALTALCALVFDVLITFFVCIFFRLQIDSNYIAVVLTILGYSLNDTIVVYDRVRENRKLYPDMEIGELVNLSINRVSIRNIVTTLTTFLAVVTIVVVSEIFGLTSLRTFAIPMAFGVVSGAFSSLFIAGPLWVIWKRYRAKKLAAK